MTEPGATPGGPPTRNSPASKGFRMPAEWARHRGTWLSWPHRESSWPGKFAPVPAVFREMVRELSPHEEVHINVADADVASQVRDFLIAGGVKADPGPKGPVFFHHNPTNDAWCRDHGPIFVQRETASGRREEAIIDWGYNAWGNKYPPFDDDDVVPTRIAKRFKLPVYHPGIVMEGGSIDVNGQGTLLTTEACLLHPNRNPTLDKTQIENYLKAFLGVTHVLWLGDGIEGDDTDGHIDDLTRFVDPSTVVTVLEEDPRDSNYKPLKDNLDRLKTMRDQDGKPLRIVTLPMPPALHHDNQRLPASYANFYIANNVVLMPGYDPKTDAVAQKALQACFPGRKIAVIDSRDLVWGLGSFHCVSQQWPAI
jgi:agmatine deiminase